MQLRPLRIATIVCCATTFDATLRGVLNDAKSMGHQAAVAGWLHSMDEAFVPMLGERIDAAADAGEDYAELWALMEALEEHDAPGGQAAAVDALIKQYWRKLDGVIDEAEEELVDMHALPEGSPRPFVGDRASAYGEVTRHGARRLFEAMGLTGDADTGAAATFVDLGSGAGRLVAQALLELPRLQRAVGVELAPSRHAAAVRGWASLAASGSPLLARTGHGAEYRQESMLETDLSDATHVYVASLCMPDALLDQLWAVLEAGAPRLEVVASLREFRAGQTPTATAEVEMTWNRAGGPGAPVYLYHVGRGVQTVPNTV